MGAAGVAHRVDLWELRDRFGGWNELQGATSADLIAQGIPPKLVAKWKNAPGEPTRGIPITMADPRYPARLRNVPFSPAVFFCEGDVACLDPDFSAPVYALVGTRSASKEGLWTAGQLAAGLAARGAVVVSGLARGIDAAAHYASCQVGRTVAVLGHGLAFTSPASNWTLRRQIVDRGGLVVSTWVDTVEPRPFRFPMRNQWIAGLSDCTVVVEAPAKSGAIHTARAALELGRELYAVPGPCDAYHYRGCLNLIQEGAGVICSVDEFLKLRVGRATPVGDAWVAMVFRGVDLAKVARITGHSIREILVQLSIMESRGLVVREEGQRYSPGHAWYAHYSKEPTNR
jgi:DNA protecting protein DprA